MDRNAKKREVEAVREGMKDVNTVFLVNFKGLSVDKDTQLRRKMRESGATYAVVKNTLLKIAFEDTEFAQLNDHLKGNTAIAHNAEDVVGLAKIIKQFAKENETFQFKAGVLDGKVIDMNELQALADLPPKEELISKLMYMLNFPIQGFATVLSALPRNLVVALDQIKQQKESA